MKIVDIEYFANMGDFAESPEFATIKDELFSAIRAVTWNDDKLFVIRPSKKHENGVNPIKNNFIYHLESKGWLAEEKLSLVRGMNPGPIDAIKQTSQGLFAVEWETGNISSSHRALNKIALGIIQNQLIGGILIIPVRNLSQHLTDRIGNYEEIAPYFHLYRAVNIANGLIGVISVDYDDLSMDAPLIPKGKDGNAKKKKTKAKRRSLKSQGR